METAKKVDVRGKVHKEVVDEFMKNAVETAGYNHGYKGISLERAMKMYNQFFKQVNHNRLVEICENENIDPWDLAEHLLTFIILVYKEAPEDLRDGFFNPLLKYEGPHDKEIIIKIVEAIEPILRERVKSE